MAPTSYRPEWNPTEPEPIAPGGYRYALLGGNMCCFDAVTGARVRQTRYLIPLSGCLFDAALEYSQPGVIHARKTESIGDRLMVCGCKKCNTKVENVSS